MRQLFAISIGLLVVLTMVGASAHATSTPSAVRGFNESFKEARSRSLRSLETEGFSTAQRQSAYEAAFKLAHIDVSKLPEWKAGFSFENGFAMTRDLRFLVDPVSARKGFLRRSSWLFPDD